LGKLDPHARGLGRSRLRDVADPGDLALRLDEVSAARRDDREVNFFPERERCRRLDEDAAARDIAGKLLNELVEPFCLDLDARRERNARVLTTILRTRHLALSYG